MQSLADIRARTGAGTLDADAALRASRDAIAADPGLKAFVRLAAEAPAGRGPLAGIAVGVKDIVDTADMATEMGSPIYAGWRPKADAPVVSRLRALGATVAGKTATTPFAHLHPTETVNPHDRAHTPGGSSSGSAAAVGAGLVPLAIGTQTGGSVIRPASFCGCAAIKPSFRLLPTVGVKCFSWTLDTVGLFAAGASDLAEALALVAGRPNLAAGERAGLRIGIVTQDFAASPEPASAEALARAGKAAEAAGATVCDIALPEPLPEAWRLHGTIQDFEARQALAWEVAHHGSDLPPSLRDQLAAAETIDANAYDDARRVAQRARRSLRDLFQAEGLDALLTFAAPGPAPAGLGSTGDARFNRLWTLMGVPCVTVPALVTSAGLPVGVQIVAPFGADDVALGAAAFIEGALRAAHGVR